MYDYNQVKEKPVKEPMNKNVAAFYTEIKDQKESVKSEKNYMIGMILFSVVVGALSGTLSFFISTVLGFVIIQFSIILGVLFLLLSIVFAPLGMLMIIGSYVKKMTDSKLLIKTYRITFIISFFLILLLYVQ